MSHGSDSIYNLLAPLAPHGVRVEALFDEDSRQLHVVFTKRYPWGSAGPNNATYCGVIYRCRPDVSDAALIVELERAATLIDEAMSKAVDFDDTAIDDTAIPALPVHDLSPGIHDPRG